MDQPLFFQVFDGHSYIPFSVTVKYLDSRIDFTRESDIILAATECADHFYQTYDAKKMFEIAWPITLKLLKFEGGPAIAKFRIDQSGDSEEPVFTVAQCEMKQESRVKILTYSPGEVTIKRFDRFHWEHIHECYECPCYEFNYDLGATCKEDGHKIDEDFQTIPETCPRRGSVAIFKWPK